MTSVFQMVAAGGLALLLAGGPAPRATPSAPAEQPREQAARQRDPLPSWRDGPAREDIFDFVARVTTEGGPEFIPEEERIAVFDNDGTLWPEQPLIEGQFALHRLRELAADDPTLRERQPFKAALGGDLAYIRSAGLPAVNELLARTHGDMSTEEFEDRAREFFRTATHPALGRPYTELAYRPMVELLDYLRENGFQAWIVSGGTQDFVRVIADEMYGVPMQQVVGTTPRLEYVERGGERVVWRTAELGSFNDKDAKPANIALHIGRRPILAAGNARSGGDVAMLTYSDDRRGPSLQLLVIHDDADREFAYAERDGASLRAAAQRGWTVISMRDDWNTIFAPPDGPAPEQRSRP